MDNQFEISLLSNFKIFVEILINRFVIEKNIFSFLSTGFMKT